MSLLIVFDFQPLFSRKLAKMFQHGWSNCISPVRAKSLSKNVFSVKVVFLFILVTSELKNLRCLLKKFSRVVKTAFYMTKWRFWGAFFWKERSFFWFSDVEQKIFGLLAKFSGRLVKTVIYVSTETFRWLFFWKEDTSFHRFPTLTAKNYPTFGGKNWQDFQNFNLVVQGNILRKQSFSRTKMSIILLLWAKTSRKLGKKFWTRIVKTAFYV